MPQFAYTAIGRDGQHIKGRDFADTRRGLEKQLKTRRLILLDCQEVRAKPLAQALVAKFIGQLSRLVGSGIVIDRALQIISEDTEDTGSSELAERLRQGIKRGQLLSQAFDEIGRFDPLLVPLVKAGEESGQLADILATLEHHYERKQKMRRDLIAALAYPSVLAIACVLSLVALGVYVIPIFKDLFVDQADSLPASTRMIFVASDLLINFGAAGLTIFCAALAGAIFCYRGSPTFRGIWDSQLLRLPVLGNFLAKIEAANMMGVLGVLLGNGISLAPAMQLTAGIVRNQRIREGFQQTLTEVRKGRRFAASCQFMPRFPNIATRFVAVGEETGRLDDLCAKVANILQDEVQTRIRGLMSMLEPGIILFMGGTVGFIVLSMLLAVYNLSALG